MPGSPIRLLCLDLGGVVVRICRNWSEGCAAAGIAERNPALWEETRPARRTLLARYQTGLIDGDAFAREASALVDGLYSPAEIRGIHDAWLLGEYHGFVELLDRVHAAGLESAALSNTNHDHWTRMADFPAVLRIRHRLASHRLGLHKPDPMIYKRLEQQLGYAGGEIIFFDDTEENVDAARSLGWQSERIDPMSETRPQVERALRERNAW